MPLDLNAEGMAIAPKTTPTKRNVENMQVKAKGHIVFDAELAGFGFGVMNPEVPVANISGEPSTGMLAQLLGCRLIPLQSDACREA